MKSTIQMKKGEKFGCLTFTGVRKNVDRRWLGEFDCDCGVRCLVRMDGVKRSNNRSCGCKSPNRNYKSKRAKMGDDYPFYVLWSVFKKNAKTRGIDFGFTVDDLKHQFEAQHGKCIYTRRDLELPNNFLRIFDPNIASIDRIDPKQGYIVNNIQLVTKTINLMKCSLSHDDFIAECQLVANCV